MSLSFEHAMIGMYKLNNIRISMGTNLADSHCVQHQLKLIKGLRNVKTLEPWPNRAVGLIGLWGNIRASMVFSIIGGV